MLEWSSSKGQETLEGTLADSETDPAFNNSKDRVRAVIKECLLRKYGAERGASAVIELFGRE